MNIERIDVSTLRIKIPEFTDIDTNIRTPYGGYATHKQPYEYPSFGCFSYLAHHPEYSNQIPFYSNNHSVIEVEYPLQVGYNIHRGKHISMSTPRISDTNSIIPAPPLPPRDKPISRPPLHPNTRTYEHQTALYYQPSLIPLFDFIEPISGMTDFGVIAEINTFISALLSILIDLDVNLGGDITSPITSNIIYPKGLSAGKVSSTLKEYCSIMYATSHFTQLTHWGVDLRKYNYTSPIANNITDIIIRDSVDKTKQFKFQYNKSHKLTLQELCELILQVYLTNHQRNKPSIIGIHKSFNVINIRSTTS